MDMSIRPRRLRNSAQLRKMVRETRIDKSSLIYPAFVAEGLREKEAITAMVGQYRHTIDSLLYLTEEYLNAGVDKMMLFGIPLEKDACGSQAFAENGIVQQAMRAVKSRFPEMYLIGDVCMCEYTSHGHCGILDHDYVDNDKTLKYLAKIALSQVEAGADMVAPSDMMDGRVAAIRQILDKNGYINIPIMSYAVKYASSFYGPFREAAGSAPAFGDRKSYQMDYHNVREGLKEAVQDVSEGADIIMVKPAMAFGDVIAKVKDSVRIPVAAYSVSGEYSMVKCAAQMGCIDEANIICEMAVSCYRAGADIYLTYFAKELAGFIDEGRIG
jgi:porphobilinogen synthase